jgi:hypothetical protein
MAVEVYNRNIMKWAFIFAVALTVAADDSPLVQASKEAKKPKDKPTAIVITNATVKQSKAKLSTTKSQRALPKADVPKKAATNDCAAPALVSAAPAAATPVRAEQKLDPFPRARTPQMDEEDVQALLEELARVPISKFPPDVTSAPQFSANTSVPTASPAVAPQSSQKP